MIDPLTNKFLWRLVSALLSCQTLALMMKCFSVYHLHSVTSIGSLLETRWSIARLSFLDYFFLVSAGTWFQMFAYTHLEHVWLGKSQKGWKATRQNIWCSTLTKVDWQDFRWYCMKVISTIDGFTRRRGPPRPRPRELRATCRMKISFDSPSSAESSGYRLACTSSLYQTVPTGRI